VIYRPLFRLTLSVLERTEDAARAYAVVIDPMAGVSGIYLGGVPWASPYFPDEAQPTFTSGTLGLVSLRTQETFQGHGASLSLLLGPIGDALRHKIRPHDLLRVELFDSETMHWRCAFDGHLANIQWTRQGDAGSYRWRMDVSAQGLQKTFSEQWLDWQSIIQALNSKNSPYGKGWSFYQQLTSMKANMPVSDLLDVFVTGSVNQFLEFGVRGQLAGFGSTYQTAKNVPDEAVAARDWQTAFNLVVLATGDWYLQQRGAIWGLFMGLVEPDVHEFFITYAQDPNSSDYQEIPTVVFRPRPWPGPAAKDVNADISPKVDDDSLWRTLDVAVAGTPDGFPAALSVTTSWNDAVRPNSFLLSFAGASDGSPNGLTADKVFLGFLVDRNLVARYGFSSRQVSIGQYIQTEADYIQKILPQVLDRVGWQEAPLPFLLDQSRSYPLWPGIHPGMVLEDHSESQSSPTTGYVISVSHTLTASEKGLHAETSVGTTRALEGVTADGYPSAVRDLVKLEKVLYTTAPEVATPFRLHMDPVHSQPGAVKPVGGVSPASGQPYDLFVTSNPELQDKNPSDAVKVNLASLVLNGIKPVEAIVGPITLTSVYRSPALNAKWKGATNSDHTLGLAFDFQMPAGSGALATAWIQLLGATDSLVYKQMVFETDPATGKQWIHYAIYPSGHPGWVSGPHAHTVAQTGD